MSMQTLEHIPDIALGHSTSNKSTAKQRIFFLLIDDPAWWIWLVTATLLAIGLAGYRSLYVAAIVLTLLQAVYFWNRDRILSAFAVQLRIAFATLLCISLIPSMRWLFWLPTMGTYAMLVFGYCLLARGLAILPWNRSEPITLNYLGRVFFSCPILPTESQFSSSGCAGGVCTIEAQVRLSE